MEPFTTAGLIRQFKEEIEKQTDNRSGNNLKYSLTDAFLGAFSVFFMQSPSFLAHQRIMQEEQGRSNAQSLFSLVNIPSDNQIRNILDTQSPSVMYPLFNYCFSGLDAAGILDTFRMEGPEDKKGDLIVALDGTEQFSSKKIHCESCSSKEYEKDKKTYSHSMITPVVVRYGREYVVPLEPEHILPQDGQEKQDCENAAAKRWLGKYGRRYSQYGVTIVGDDLYAKVPVCEAILNEGLNFILVCKPESHKTVYEWIKGIKAERVEDRFDGKSHQIYTYSYAENVPLRETQKKDEKTFLINFVEVTVKDRKTGRQLYHNAFVTNHSLQGKTEEETIRILGIIVDSGRARWKIENENNNTLKTKGYHFEHNYGHGKKYLATLLSTMIILAFLFHTMLSLCNKAYQSILSKLPSRVIFFQHLQALTSYLYYDNWEHLFAFMEQGLKKRFNISEILPMIKAAPG